MMCKHTMYGKNINKKVIFIASCNPYTTLTKKIEVADIVNKKEQKKKKFGL